LAAKEHLILKKGKSGKKIFEKLGLKIIAENRVFTKFSSFDPIKRILFVLEKGSEAMGA
jgi:hypothetical protein